MIHNKIPFWIAIIIVGIVNLRKLIRSKLPIEYKVILFISGAICYITFEAYAYNGDIIGNHNVLLEGYIQNGAYFVARPGHAAVQISEYDYKLNLILGIGTIVSFAVHIIISIIVFWEE